MNLLKQLSVLKSGENPLTPDEFNAIYDVTKERMNSRGLEGSLLMPYSIRQANKNIDDVTNIINGLLEHGFIHDEWVFWEEDGEEEHEFFDLEEDEKAELAFELEKSKSAKEKYGQHSREYFENCGNIVHPEKGIEGFDPLVHLGKRYFYSNKLITDPSLIKYNDQDKDMAMKELFPPEMNEALEKRAQEIAMERLGLLK